MYRISNPSVKNNTISIARPDLLLDWDYEKNASICSPDEVTIGSSKKVWWKCHICGAEYYKRIAHVKNGHGCKVCLYKRRGSETVANYPVIAKEWDYEKNSPLTPSDVTVGSNKKMWWICPKGHSYSTTAWNRIKNGSGCTICIGKKVLPGFNDLASQYPDIASEFHPTKNGSLTPDKVAPKSHKKVWWKGKCGHEWEQVVSNRTGQGRGCPYCTGQKVLVGETDLATVDPELAAEWNYEKNNGLRPTDVTSGSKKKVWWKCKEGHEWQAYIKSRHYYKTGCPYCPNTRTVIVTKGVNDFASRYPELAKDWHPTKNRDLTPDNISYASGKKAWWICKNGHEYQMIIGNKAKGRGCPVCSRRRRTSFPEQAIYYYVKKVYPNAINSYKDIFEGAMELDVFIPETHIGIEYDGKVFHRSEGNINRDLKKYQICQSQGIHLIRIVHTEDISVEERCDYCIHISSERKQELENAIKHLFEYLHIDIDINLTRDRFEILQYLEALDVSLESEFPEIAKEFDEEKNGHLKASYFHSGSNESVWWKCSKCGFEWKTKIIERTGEDKTGCPKCAKERGAEKKMAFHLKKNGSLEETNPELLPFWNYEKNTVLPSEIIAGTTKKIWWRCEKGHEWQASADHASGRGLRCPYCLNKRILKGYNDLATVNPALAQEWHPTKNGDVTPFDIGSGSGKKAWWICEKGHEWQAVIHTRSNGIGCPYCSNKKVLKGYNDLETKYPEIASEWNYDKNDSLPSDYVFGSHEEAWWKCSKCGFEYKMRILHRTRTNSGCPCCSGRVLLKGINDLKSVNPVLAIEWDYEKNPGKVPEDYLPNSGKKAWWKCIRCGHEWEAIIRDRNHGQGCPVCKDKKEVPGQLNFFDIKNSPLN